MIRIRFHHYAWGLLVYVLAVILGGAFVRASISGDGCGSHWPDCNGQMIPDLSHAGSWAKTLTEWSHRASSGVLVALILALVLWAFWAHPKGHPARISALFALSYTFVEALLGAALVHYHWVAQDRSVYRAIVMPIHLVTTFMLLMALTLTAWWSSGGRALRLRDQGAMGWAVVLALLAMLVLGVTGAITALGDTLFPVVNVWDGIRQDFMPSAHFLIGLRIYHPLIAMSVGLYLTLIAGLTMRLRPSADVQRFARLMIALFMAQMGAGLLNLMLSAPIWMQLVHLMCADLLWITVVLLAAASLAEGVPKVELAAIGGDRGGFTAPPQPARPGATIWRSPNRASLACSCSPRSRRC
jgi:heme A synthase